ncbi:restriction endonuclease subunit S [Vibrio sp. 1-Bac 57]|uniref:restriction endonuclease subunit S n=1 Tax=Psychromonas arctica TaxID=168275 RepID=UPI0004114E86|nr:restriction endonuclease subunit S [Psychromonas arctica]
MSHLTYLEKQLDGVEVNWKPLWQVTIWDKKFNAVDRKKQPKVINYKYLLAVDLFKLKQESGDVFLLSTGEQTGWTNEKLAGSYLREGEIVTIPWGKSRPVKDVIKYYKGRFVTADNRIATSNNTDELLNKYLYYWMMSKSQAIDKYYRGSGIQHPSMANVLDMLIPVPPLKNQTEIVRILDTFTAMTAELTAELNMRKKQYTYYRDQLLRFEDGEVEWVTLNKVANIKNGKDWKKLGPGNIPVYGSGGIMQYVDTFAYDKPTVLIPRKGSITNIFYVDEPFWNVDTIYYTELDLDKIIPKFFYYFMTTIDMMQLDTGSGRPSLTQAILNEIKVPLPPLDEQGRIVTILDKFDTLTTSIQEGLPREIELRQKQYEYYRDLLLSFPQSNSDEPLLKERA